MSRPTEAETVPVPLEVARVVDGYGDDVRAGVLALRDLVLSTAAETEGVGTITETLKWGQPAYLTSETGSGSTIRIAPTSAGSNHDFAMFFICRTNLVDGFRSLFGDAFTYDGTRALLFRCGEALPSAELRICIEQALTYHQRSNAET